MEMESARGKAIRVAKEIKDAIGDLERWADNAELAAQHYQARGDEKSAAFNRGAVAAYRIAAGRIQHIG